MKKTNHNFDPKEDYIDFITPPRASTYGGEVWIDDHLINDWGIQLDELSIGGLDTATMKDLGLAVINHLMTCGYSFEIGWDANGDFLKIKDQQP